MDIEKIIREHHKGFGKCHRASDYDKVRIADIVHVFPDTLALAIRKALHEEIEGMKHDNNDYDYEAALTDVQDMIGGRDGM